MNWRHISCVFLLVVTLVFASAPNSSAIIYGDLDFDGKVRLADALLGLRIVAGTYVPTQAEMSACDVFGGGGPAYSPDGTCTIVDTTLILYKANGLIDF